MLTKSLTAVLVASLASHAQASPAHASQLRERTLLGSSFGVPGDNVTYDYIIVGGGNAGLTVAARLAEQNIGSVAVVEAGSFYEISNGNYSQIPADDAVFSSRSHDDWQPEVDWGYQTTPQTGALNYSIHYARGKTLGGCTARNFMVYQRPTIGSMQKWADEVGDTSYEWDNFLPYFKKSINFTTPNQEMRFANSTPGFVLEDAAYTGTKVGPVGVSFPNYAQPFASWAIKGLNEIGLATLPGFLSGKLIGTSWVSSTVHGTTMNRVSSETAFLDGALKTTQLKVHPLTLAKQILFDESKKATGVLVETGGFTYLLSARKEIIITGGVFNTPQLLQVSGVGPKDLLESLDIPVIVDSPGVGTNMNDHIFFDVTYRVNVPTLTKVIDDPVYAAEQAALFNSNPPQGQLTNPNTDVLGWEKIPDKYRSSFANESVAALAEFPSDWPEAEYLVISTDLGPQLESRALGPNDGFNYAALAAALISPVSRGTVKIVSKDTNVLPLVDPGYLTAQADRDVTVGAFKRLREFWTTDALKNITIGEEYYPGSKVQTDADILEFIQSTFNTVWHATSTAAMGPSSNPNAVVDTKGQVYGVTGLRVADAAAFPFLAPGHLMSVVYALAEKIADDIVAAA